MVKGSSCIYKNGILVVINVVYIIVEMEFLILM